MRILELRKLLGFPFKKTFGHKNNRNEYEEGKGQHVKASSGNGSHFRKEKKDITKYADNISAR